MNLNLSASVGFIALFGVAMLNGVVLVSSINQLREGGYASREAVLGGARRTRSMAIERQSGTAMPKPKRR
jgi:cobalt-zinc-cadmium resistance protein CzcA